MEKKCPFGSLWSAGVIVALFSLLAYLTLTRPDTGVITALWIVVATLFKLIPFAVGLAIGIAFCVAAVLAIYVACAYIVDPSFGREACARAKCAVRGQVASLLAFVAPGKFGQGGALTLAGEVACTTGTVGVACTLDKETPSTGLCRIAESGSVGVDAGLSQVLDRLRTFDARMQAMEKALHGLQEKSCNFVDSERVAELSAKIQGVEESSRQSLEGKTAQIQEQLEKHAGQHAALQPLAKSIEELNARFTALEQQQNTLPKDLAALREDFSGKITDFSQQLADLKGEVAEQLKFAQSGKGKSGGGKKKGPAQ